MTIKVWFLDDMSLMSVIYDEVNFSVITLGLTQNNAFLLVGQKISISSLFSFKFIKFRCSSK